MFFSKCGIYPFSKDIIWKDKILPVLPTIMRVLRKAIMETVLNQLKISQSAPMEVPKRGPKVKRNYSDEVLTVLVHIRINENAKKLKQEQIQQQKAAAASKKLKAAAASKK